MTENKKEKSRKEKSKKDKSKKDKSIFHKKSDAGKGDKIRRSITQVAWGEKWEKIFRPKDYRDINK